MYRDAIFSPCRTWRYSLLRFWDCNRPYVQFIGLNPSTATETKNDPTVRRCINYAKDWGYGGMVMTNIFGYRATDPRDMKAYQEPIGPENDFWLQSIANGAGLIVASWGNHGEWMGRGGHVAQMISNICCLKITGAGHPSHPLYLKKTLEPIWYPSGRSVEGYRMINEEQLCLFDEQLS